MLPILEDMMKLPALLAMDRLSKKESLVSTILSKVRDYSKVSHTYDGFVWSVRALA